MMKPEVKEFLKNSSIELLVYAALVTGYFCLVLHFLGHWLYTLFSHERRMYAGVALALILGQGVVLEWLTTVLIRLVRAMRRR
jgi:hypothetical protein